MTASIFQFVTLALALAQCYNAAHLPLVSRSSTSSTLRRRAELKAAGGPSMQAMGDAFDIRYLTNITLGGQSKIVVVDSGSVDLVIAGNYPGSIDYGISTSVTYAAGTFSGKIIAHNLVFAGHSVQVQAFVNLVGNSDTKSMFQGADGILGMALFSESTIEHLMGLNASAAPFLDNVFASDKTTPNFISFLLQRNSDPDSNVTAELTIGEIVKGYENVTNMPQNPVINATTVGHWQLSIDGVSGPDGSQINFPIKSGAAKSVAVLDTGAPTCSVPKEMSDALYSHVPGAYFDPSYTEGVGSWVLPCNTEVNASFAINGVNYFMHPLDMLLRLPSKNGTMGCIGTWQPNTLGANFGTFDFLLGDPFLRNVYSVLNYGDFIASNAQSSRAPPYIQLLPLTTDTVQAHKEFQDALGVLNGTVKPVSKGFDIKTSSGAIGQQPILMWASLLCFSLIALLYL